MAPTVSATNGVTSRHSHPHSIKKGRYLLSETLSRLTKSTPDRRAQHQLALLFLLDPVYKKDPAAPAINCRFYTPTSPFLLPLNECALAFLSPPPRVPYTAADAINLFSQLHDFPGVAFLKSFYCSHLPLNSILKKRLCNGRQDGKSRGANPAVCNTSI
jgi:hypothetical protein